MSKAIIKDFKDGDKVRYDGSHGDEPETGTVSAVDHEENILVVVTKDGEYREWDPHTCTVI